MSTRVELINAIEAQIATNNPGITATTLTRLLNDGATRELAISKMADALFEHMKEMLKDDEKFIESKHNDRFNQIQIIKQ